MSSTGNLNTSGITPLGDRCIVEVLPEEKTTKGGIILLDTTVDKNEAAKAEAILLESGSVVSTLVDIWPEPGARVLISKYAGMRVQDETDGAHIRIVNWEDIVGFRKGEQP